MKILMTTDTLGGVWTYALELSRALASHNVSVTLATMGAPLSAGQRRVAGQLPNVEVFESRYRLEWMHDPWDDVARAGDWLLQLADQSGAELVHLNGYAHGALPWRVPTLMVGHSCVVSWFAAVRRHAPGSEWDRYRREVQRGLQAADSIIAPTSAMLAELDRHYGPFCSQQVIYNGVAPDSFRVEQKEPRILAAGRLWDEAKNIAALAAAAPNLPWPVYVAGDNQHPEGKRNEFSGVELLGRLSAPEMADQFARAAIYALPARYEPFGLSVLEAALSGCVLVLGDIATLRELWDDVAWFVAPDSQEQLTATLNRLCDDPLLRAEYAQRARQRAQAFTAAQMAAHYCVAYQQLLAHRSPASVKEYC